MRKYALSSVVSVVTHVLQLAACAHSLVALQAAQVSTCRQRVDLKLLGLGHSL